MDRSTAPLTPAMTEAIKATGPEDVMAGGSTRTGLINRGMVHPKDSDRFGKLTESGLQIRAKLLPAPAPEPEVEDVPETECPRCGGPLASDGVCADDSCGDEDAPVIVVQDEVHAAFLPSAPEPRHEFIQAQPSGAGKSALSDLRSLRVYLKADATPALVTLAKAAQGLGRTLRPILEAGVMSARTIPDGRKRHGQVKARRDALRHARKLELAGI